jgi:integrase
MLAYSGLRETALLMLAEDSARRRGGLANLKISELNFFEDDDGEYGVVGRTIEKGEKPQILLAGHEAVMALKAWLYVRKQFLELLKVRDHGYVFINLHDGSPLTPDNMTRAVSRLRQRAGVPADQPAGLHSRRHRRAKELLKVLDLPTVRDILGHEEASTTADMYAVNGEEELVDAFFNRARKKK